MKNNITQKRASKQIIVVRKDLRNSKGEKIRTGKYCSQSAHASLKAILDLTHREPNEMSQGSEGNEELIISLNEGSALKDWIDGLFTKITVYVNSEAELIAVYSMAKDKGLICSLITDAGLTEFGGISTITCCAIGPCWEEELVGITDKLPLL